MNFYYYDCDRSRYGEALALDAAYDYEQCLRCPECGSRVSGGKWISPFHVEIDGKLLIKGKFPDVIPCFGCDSPILLSERALELYRKACLTGIVHTDKISSVRLNDASPHTNKLPTYYNIRVVKSRMQICRKKTLISYGAATHHPMCPICNPAGKITDFIVNLHFDDALYEGCDIFSPYETGDEVFFSQRFVDFCKENHLINFSPAPIVQYGNELSELF